MKAFTRAEKLPKPKLSEMFNDVWAVQPGEKVPTIIVSYLLGHFQVLTSRWSNELNLAGFSRSMAMFGNHGEKRECDLWSKAKMSWTVMAEIRSMGS
jgi:hypothetical protein